MNTKTKPATVTLYSYELVPGGLGIFDREWFPTREAAEEARAQRIKRDGYRKPADGLTGEQLEIGDVEPIDVELSAAGVLSFAREYAIDSGAC